MSPAAGRAGKRGRRSGLCPDAPGRPGREAARPGGAREPESNGLGLSPRLHRLQRLRAPFPPRIELVRGVSVLPGLLRLVLLSVEPECPAQLVVRLDEIRSERDGFLEERLRVLEHVALEVHQSKIRSEEHTSELQSPMYLVC